MVIASIIIFIALIGIPFYFILKSSSARQKKREFYLNHFPEAWKEILKKRVGYYNRLSEEDQNLFHKKISDFLSEASISGVGVDIDDSIRLLVACSAIIPVFRFE